MKFFSKIKEKPKNFVDSAADGSIIWLFKMMVEAVKFVFVALNESLKNFQNRQNYKKDNSQKDE